MRINFSIAKDDGGSKEGQMWAIWRLSLLGMNNVFLTP
jgi:hypothetical protein